jgi:hypothetical protein
VSDSRVRAFFASSLDLWNVQGIVDIDDASEMIVIRPENGTVVWVERVRESDVPFRWAVRWRAAPGASHDSRERRPKLCGSLVGALNAVRLALGVERGSPLRISQEPHDMRRAAQ